MLESSVLWMLREYNPDLTPWRLRKMILHFLAGNILLLEQNCVSYIGISFTLVLLITVVVYCHYCSSG